MTDKKGKELLYSARLMKEDCLGAESCLDCPLWFHVRGSREEGACILENAGKPSQWILPE